MNMIHLVSCLVLLCCATAQEWQLIWSDEFDGDSIDPNNWEHEVSAGGNGNGEFQVYTPDPTNSFVRDGIAYLKPTLLEENINPLTGEPFGQEFLYNGTLDLEAMYGYCTDSSYEGGCYRVGNGEGEELNINPIASAKMRTRERFTYRYGRVEVRAKTAVADWTWPAVWMLPEHWCYGGWPRSGELDIVEAMGNEDFRYADGSPLGIQRNGQVLHWGMQYDDNRYYYTLAYSYEEEIDFGNNFHDFVFEWTPNGIRFFIDGNLTMEVPSPPIDENPDWEGFFEWGKPWYSINDSDPSQNPWANAHDPLMVPFDTEFHFIFNVAVGSTHGYIPDDAINRGGAPEYGKPWNNTMTQNQAMTSFYNSKAGWLWNWEEQEANGENNALQVDYIRVYKRDDLPGEPDPPCPALNEMDKLDYI